MTDWAARPLIEGVIGWIPDQPAPFDPERPGKFPENRRALPAAIRLWSQKGHSPNMTEKEAFAAVRNLIRPGVRTRRIQPPRDDNAPNTRKLMMWLWLRERAAKWWASQWGWRSPIELPGWRELERELGAPHVEPGEIARLRLPEDIVLDLDVVILQAYCQGVTGRWISQIPELDLEGRTPQAAVFEGLRKFHRSPWIRFALSAPHLQPVGFRFPKSTFSESMLRMDAILRDPYKATDGELEHIFGNYVWEIAYARAAGRRSRGGTRLQPGPWYSCGMAEPLGPHFRRGGTRSYGARRDDDGPEEEG